MKTVSHKPLMTTTIGAYPKPFHLPVPTWFDSKNMNDMFPSAAYEVFLQSGGIAIEDLDTATHEVVRHQTDLQIDVPSEGEIRRENYIYYHCRHLDGIDFSVLTKKTMRNGAWEGFVPTVRGPIKAQSSFLVHDYRAAQSATDHPVKITLPGPITIADTIANSYYQTEQELCSALADALREEIIALVDAGCTWIQIDEPLFARFPQKALTFGIGLLDRCFADLPDNVMTAVHICCGYPQRVNQDDYPKANPQSYQQLASALNRSCVKAVSLEHAHRQLELPLLQEFTDTSVILGVIDISKTRIETVEEIVYKIEHALNYISPDRLILAPDCGLGLLSHDIVHAKLRNMVTAVEHVKNKRNL